MGINAIEAIKKKLFREDVPATQNQQGTTSFLAHISVDDFSKTGTVPNWNAGNVPMTGNNIT